MLIRSLEGMPVVPMGDPSWVIYEQVRGSAPFKMRLFASQPLGVRDFLGFWMVFWSFCWMVFLEDPKKMDETNLVVW